ncbi:MAG: ribulose-phosphate 3-epimerase [Pseudomonadota bacterium]
MSPPIHIAPSLLAADFSDLRTELASAQDAGADRLHLDVMDHHYVPNLSFGPPVIAALRAHSRLPFDVHLMVTPVEPLIEASLRAGADRISIHPSTAHDLGAVIAAIRNGGAEPSLALKFTEPIAPILPYLHDIADVLVMSVEPGFGGQSFQPAALEHLRTLRAHAPDLSLSVDGGITLETAPAALAAGATTLIAGTSFFRARNRAQMIVALRSCSTPS